MGGVGGLDLNGGSGDDDKWFSFRCILKMELVRFIYDWMWVGR